MRVLARHERSQFVFHRFEDVAGFEIADVASEHFPLTHPNRRLATVANPPRGCAAAGPEPGSDKQSLATNDALDGLFALFYAVAFELDQW